MSLRIEIPWPSQALSANGRVHWAVKARATKVARVGARMLTMSALHGGGGTILAVRDELPMRWTFCPPRRGRFDRDNLIGRCKALQDGIADALGIDDSRFVPTYCMGEPVKGGLVVVEIAPEALAAVGVEGAMHEA